MGESKPLFECVGLGVVDVVVAERLDELLKLEELCGVGFIFGITSHSVDESRESVGVVVSVSGHGGKSWNVAVRKSSKVLSSRFPASRRLES